MRKLMVTFYYPVHPKWTEEISQQWTLLRLPSWRMMFGDFIGRLSSFTTYKLGEQGKNIKLYEP